MNEFEDKEIFENLQLLIGFQLKIRNFLMQLLAPACVASEGALGGCPYSGLHKQFVYHFHGDDYRNRPLTMQSS